MKRQTILAVGLLVTALATVWTAPAIAQSVNDTTAGNEYYYHDSVSAREHHNWMHDDDFDDHHREIHGDDW